MRITPGHDKNRQEKAGRFHHARRYTRCTVSQPPDQRTYSAEVTSFLSNLPHHRRLRPHRRSIIILCNHEKVKHIFLFFAKTFYLFLVYFAPKMGSSHSVPRQLQRGFAGRFRTQSGTVHSPGFRPGVCRRRPADELPASVNITLL